MLIIGVSGHIGSGKDAAASFLTNQYGFTRMGFADALKHEVERTLQKTLRAYCRTVYGTDELDMIRRLLWKDREDFSRSLLQEWGTELRRSEDQDYWVKALEKNMLASGAPRIVVPDVRFQNEAVFIRKWGGRLIKVDRPGLAPDDQLAHVSEDFCRTWDGWDTVFKNDRSIADLEGNLAKWLAESLDLSTGGKPS